MWPKYSVLKPVKQRYCFNKKIYGFDIETYDNNKKFLLGTIYDGCNFKVFQDKKLLVEEFKKDKYKNSYIAATNLQFDFMATFFSEKDINKFRFLWRGSDLIYAKSYIINKSFSPMYQKGKSGLIFIDTFNYAQLSVDKIGQILKLPKIHKPYFLGQKPKTKQQLQQLIDYNKRDAELSQKFIVFLFDSFVKLGATPKITIASTSMNLYKSKFLKQDYFRHSIGLLLQQFEAYYGGNCHAYARGKIKNYYHYDFNSLYPSVMMNEYPNPNFVRTNKIDTVKYLDSFDGITKATVYIDYIYYPLLPYRMADKLIFPYGTFTGWFTNAELRKAVDLGYVIKKVHKSIYFKENCLPFYEYVKELYDLRLKYQTEDSPMQLIVKLLMNSLYGKFGQKFVNRENLLPFNLTLKELHQYDYFERIGNFIRVRKSVSRPAAFCIPIWALYTTAYGRLKLYDYIKKSDAIYVDTDSLITKKEFVSSNQLGKLKLETTIKNGIIIKPKFYMINNKVRVKGVGFKVSTNKFMQLLHNPKVTYEKFMKFRESIRRGFIPNEIQDITKQINLEDDKRYWSDEFNFNEFQMSEPLQVNEKTNSIILAKKIIPLQSVV